MCCVPYRSWDCVSSCFSPPTYSFTFSPVPSLFLSHRFSEALQEAAQVDKFLDEEKAEEKDLEARLPFLGVPFTAKEAFALRGASLLCLPMNVAALFGFCPPCAIPCMLNVSLFFCSLLGLCTEGLLLSLRYLSLRAFPLTPFLF